MHGFIMAALANYASFFSVAAFKDAICTQTGILAILTLVLLEALLSTDNALVLAVMVRGLPENLRKKALLYGIWGAYAFRFIAIGLGTFLIKFAAIKAAGAAYLAFLSGKYFYMKLTGKHEEQAVVAAAARSFIMTVAQVELMDIAFSADSILAAFGVSEKVWVVLLGGMFGILMMRGVAQVFVSLLEKVPELESAAYILIGIISGKMFAGVLGYEMYESAFFGSLVAVFGATFLVNKMKRPAAALPA